MAVSNVSCKEKKWEILGISTSFSFQNRSLKYLIHKQSTLGTHGEEWEREGRKQQNQLRAGTDGNSTGLPQITGKVMNSSVMEEIPI